MDSPAFPRNLCDKFVENIELVAASPPVAPRLRYPDPARKEAILYYTDENCSVMDIEYDGHRCILWLKPYLKDTVPQVCIDHFVDTCGVVIFPNRRDLCDDGEGDY
ncbi:hypothetical protein MTO96_039612 [Rhipicephalus appendiculatus]